MKRAAVVLAALTVGLMACGGNDHLTTATTTPTPTTERDPVAERQLASLQQFWANYTPAEEEAFCTMFVEQFLGKYGSNVSAEIAFVAGYEQAQNIKLRPRARVFLLGKLDECIESYGR